MRHTAKTNSKTGIFLALWGFKNSILILSMFLFVSCGGGRESSPADCDSNPECTPQSESNPITGDENPLPDSTDDDTLNPVPEFGSEPQDPPNISDPVNPAPNGIQDLTGYYIEPELVGDWSTLEGTRETGYTLNADGSCEWAQVQYQTQIIGGACEWGMTVINNKKMFLFEYPGIGWYAYQYEKGFANNFRISGSDLKAESWLFNQALPNTMEGLFPGRWFVGPWNHGVSLSYSQIADFKLDGSLEVITYRNVDSIIVSTRLGTWTVDATNLNYQIDETPTLDGDFVVNTPKSGSYLLTEMSFNTFIPAGMSDDPIRQTYNRRLHYFYRDDLFVGHYTGPSTTMTISKTDESTYSLELLYEGAKVVWPGYSLNGYLHIPLPPELQFLGITEMVLAPKFNGIRIDSATPELSANLANDLTKMSEGAIEFPSTIVGGTWHNRLKSFDDTGYTLLPDGQFLSYSGNIRDEGTYQITGTGNNGQITIDPICSAPYTYDFALVDDQWVWRLPQNLGEDLFPVYHYQAASQETIEIDTLYYNASQAAENAYWRSKFSVSAIDPTYVPVPVAITDTGTVPVNPDPSPTFVHDGKQVFSDLQIYTWRMPSLWCLGNVCNSSYFHFYPSGRGLIYSKDFWGITEFTGEPLGTTNHFWFRYHIEQDQIVIEDNLSLPILKGMRKVRHGEFCYENLNWQSGNI